MPIEVDDANKEIQPMSTEGNSLKNLWSWYLCKDFIIRGLSMLF